MKNYVQKGETLTVNAPAGGVASGAVVLVNKLLGIAAADAAEGAAFEVQVEGVFSVPKGVGRRRGGRRHSLLERGERQLHQDGERQ